eukprot:SAG25_NODE_3092_length_1222_cov_3.320570_1_plen_183_part_00
MDSRGCKVWSYITHLLVVSWDYRCQGRRGHQLPTRASRSWRAQLSREASGASWKRLVPEEMGRGVHVKAAHVVDIKERAERLEAIRAKDKRRYRGRVWDYIADQSVHSADTCQQVLSGYYDHLLAGSPKGDEPEEPPSDGIPVAVIHVDLGCDVASDEEGEGEDAMDIVGEDSEFGEDEGEA